LKSLEGEELISNMTDYWDKYLNIFVKWLKKCFQYLDQHHTKQYNVEKLEPRGISLFKEHVFAPLKIKILEAFLESIQSMREDPSIPIYKL